MLQKLDDGTIVDRTVEKVYPINSKRKRRNGEEYIYQNFEVFVPYEYLEMMGITDHMFMYHHNGKVYLTSERPDGTVPAKKLSVHKQRGSQNSRKYQPERTANNRWKRFFIIPRKFFPYVSENKKAVFTLNPNEDDLFNGVSATLGLELEDIEE